MNTTLRTQPPRKDGAARRRASLSLPARPEDYTFHRLPAAGSKMLCQHRVDDMPADIGEPKITPGMPIG